MSASREKKTRQDLSGSGWNDPKTAREAKQRQKEHSTNLLYGTIGVVFLIGFTKRSSALTAPLHGMRMELPSDGYASTNRT